jgi:hypothetical protein
MRTDDRYSFVAKRLNPMVANQPCRPLFIVLNYA